MFSFFKKKPEPRKHGIKFRKVYDDVKMPAEVVSAPSEQTAKTLDDMVANPERYAFKQQQKDGLVGRPKIKIALLQVPEAIPETNIDVIAEVTFTYTTQVPPAPKNRFVSFIWFLFFTSLLGGAMLMFFGYHSARQFDIENQCYMYTKEGKPNFVQVDGERYYFNEDGTMDKLDGTFLNPWHRQVLESGDCVWIDTER